jgi:hypothetical protein
VPAVLAHGQAELRDRRRAFTCCGCGCRIAPGGSVALVDLLVLRRRRSGDGQAMRWEHVQVIASARYPARACRRCADSWPGKVRP